MQNKALLEQLKSAGLNIASGGENPATIFESFPEYRGNYGFNLVTAPNFQAILIKGVYKDFLRILSGACSLSENDWNEVAKTLNTAEATFKRPAALSLFVEDGICFVKTAELRDCPSISVSDDRRDYMIPRPLTSVEYSIPASKLYDDSVMVSGGYFAEYFPRTLSHFTESVFTKIPDILNPIFVSCNLKTSSPSSLCVYNRLYINMTLYEKMMAAVGLGNQIYRLKFAPHLYLKQQSKIKRGTLNKSYFPVEDKDIDELLTEMERTAGNINPAALIEDSFFEYPVQLTIGYEYIDIKLQDVLAELLKFFTLPRALKAVFKTRENSIFYSGEKRLPRCFDFASEVVDSNFNLDKNIDSIDKHLEGLSFFRYMKSGGHIKRVIKTAHKLLDMRDKLYISASEFVVKSGEALLKIGDIACSKGKADRREDIFYFEHDEVKKIYNDSFFSDATQSINFRKWQIRRYAAQTVPPEIYGVDFEKCPQLSEKMIVKFLELAELDALSLNGGEASGLVTKDLSKSDYKGLIIAAKSLYPADLPKYAEAEAFVLENASPFGFACEYAILKNKPIFTGLRFAPLILDNVKIKASGNKISKI